MPDATPLGITFPLPSDYVKDTAVLSALTDWFKALANTADTAIANGPKLKILLGSENLHTMSDGSYVPVTPAVAVSLGLPHGNYGLLQKVTQSTWGSSITWIPWNDGEGAAELWIKRRFGDAKWLGWEKVGDNMNILTGSEVIADLTDGYYMPLSGTAAVSLGLPSRNVGPLNVRTFRGGPKSFKWDVIDGDVRTYKATKLSDIAAMSKWEEFRPTSAPSGHWMRENELRRIYEPPELGSAIPVAIIFDHGCNVMKSSILPALTANGLTATLALNSDGLNPENRQYPENDLTTWAEIDGWPVEKANHGHLHDDFTTPGEILNNIKNGLKNLKASLPNSPILAWVQTGNGANSWYGFNDGRTVDNYINTPVGQYILEHHACSTGLLGGGVTFPFYTMDGTIKQGVHGFWIDTPAGITDAKAHIETAITSRKGAIIRCHPGLLGAAGQSTVQEVVDFLAWFGAKQAAGSVKSLKFSQWNLAKLDTDTGVVMKSPNGTRYHVTVSDTGQLTATAI